MGSGEFAVGVWWNRRRIEVLRIAAARGIPNDVDSLVRAGFSPLQLLDAGYSADAVEEARMDYEADLIFGALAAKGEGHSWES